MTESETRAIVAISLMAAFADGAKHEREREEIRRIAEGLARDGLHLPTLYQDVLMKRVSLESAGTSASIAPKCRTGAMQTRLKGCSTRCG